MNCELYGSMRGAERSDFGCVKINSHLVMVVGGKINLKGLKACHIFDLKSRRWSKGPSLPIEMMFCRATLVGKYVYICGLYKEFLRMNIEKENVDWQRLPSMKVDGLGCELVSDSRYVYRIGDNNRRTTFSRFDTKDKVWESLPSLSEGRSMFGAAMIGDEIYAIGGRSGLSGDTILNSIEIYNCWTNKWRPGAQLPRSLFGHSVHAIENFVFVSGGQSTYNSNPLASMFVLNVSNQEWSQVDVHLSTGVTGHSMLSLGWKMFIFEGKCASECIKKGGIYMIKLTRGFPCLTKQSSHKKEENVKTQRRRLSFPSSLSKVLLIS